MFLEISKKILNKDRILNKKQGLLTNGYQTSGNLFSLERDLTENIEKIIRLAIENYLVFFKDSLKFSLKIAAEELSTVAVPSCNEPEKYLG